MSILSTLKDNYPSGSQTLLYIGDAIADEINEIQFKYTVDQRPIYSYADNHMRGVTAGQVLAHGAFSINYTYDGYLWALIKNFKKGGNADTSISQRIKSIKDPGSESGMIVPTNFLSSGTGNNDAADKMKDALRNKFWGNKQGSTNLIRPEFMNKFNVVVYYGDPNDPDTQYQKLIDVVLTDNQKVIQNNGEPIAEVYSFIAKSII